MFLRRYYMMIMNDFKEMQATDMLIKLKDSTYRKFEWLVMMHALIECD